MTRLSLAIRAYTLPRDTKPHVPKRVPWVRPDTMLVFDTETRTDPTQPLMFGCYRLIVRGVCMEEGLFYGEDLRPEELTMLTAYVDSHAADVAADGRPELRLLSLREFMDGVFYPIAYKARGLVVAFNLPFDLSRIAIHAAAGRGRYARAFSLGLWEYVKDGVRRLNGFRPRLQVKSLGSKRALVNFTGAYQTAAEDRIPPGSRTGRPEQSYIFPGQFLDLHTLAWALTDKNYRLADACKVFQVEHEKAHAEEHGRITDVYIDYNRRDVLATWELAEALLAEYAKHPVTLAPTKALSSAAIGKAYLRDMGIAPILDRQPTFPAARLGHAQSAFFGGRTSAHIRRTVVPVVYTDFLSMYPTVNSLLRTWRFVTAKQIEIVDCAEEVAAFLHGLRPVDLFEPQTWPKLAAFVRVIPDGDVLPARAQYGLTHDWQIGVNHLHGDGNPDNALWYALPDVVASVLLTGRPPKIVEAFRLEAHGALDTLRPIRLGGEILIDPRTRDFFTAVIEERTRAKTRADVTEDTRKRLDKALKVLANATGYGIYAEMHQEEGDEPIDVTCHGIDADPFTCRVKHPEKRGEYYFSPLASLTTSAARLMLALLEHCVHEAGGTYAMEDTDSMAIVATESGGLVPCHGGPHTTSDGRSAMMALSWAGVDRIVARFAALNPYDRTVVRGSILKIEEQNFDPETKVRRQLYCLAISAKRYALFTLDSDETPTIVKRSEHGLGHLLNPTDPEAKHREWIGQVWRAMVLRTLGHAPGPFAWERQPAVSQMSISTPEVWTPFAAMNGGKAYADQLKPFNFVLTCHVNAFGYPDDVNPEQFHLIAPYEKDPRRWPVMPWTDQYSGAQYRITTEGHHGGPGVARVKTYGDVLNEYEWHPEPKCAGLDGQPADRQTIGLMRRRHIQIGVLKYIGKESNHLEEVEAGVIHDSSRAYTEYPDPKRDEWERTRKVLHKIPLAKAETLTGIGRRVLIDVRRERRQPHERTRRRLIELAHRLRLL